ncbi:MAG: hypothetical protein QG626_324 [Patescibacteria group bacterium]|jgi:hypothetical protein|nr:hypothetical protein [Patescibacteria group bacterium]
MKNIIFFIGLVLIVTMFGIWFMMRPVTRDVTEFVTAPLGAKVYYECSQPIAVVKRGRLSVPVDQNDLDNFCKKVPPKSLGEGMPYIDPNDPILKLEE